MTADDIRGIADRLQIADVLYACAGALDARDWQLLSSCFTPDAEETFGAGRRAEGRDAIEEFCRTALDGLDRTQHLVSNVRIAVRGDRADVRSYFHAQHVRSDAQSGPTFTVAGTYEDEFVRSPDGWRIISRRLIRTWTEGNPAVLAST